MSEQQRLLVVASRPSDYVEMSDLARTLARRGHRITFLYFYSSTDPSSSTTVQQVVLMGSEPGIETAGVDVSSTWPIELRTYKEIADDQAAASAAQAKQAVKPSNRAIVWLRARLRMPSFFGMMRSTVSWARRHNLHRFYPKNTFVSRGLYSLTYAFDNFSVNELLTTFRQTAGQVVMIVRLGLVGRREAFEIAYQNAMMMAHYSRAQQFFTRSIRRRSIDVLIIPEDIVGNLWPVAVLSAHRRHIPAIVVPYTLANRQEAVQSLKSEAAYQTGNNEVAANLYPRWRYQNGDIDIVRLPSPHIFAHEKLRITPPDPWTMNSGFSDKILVDSDASFRYFSDAGIPADQLATVGSVSQDRMFELRAGRAAQLAKLRADLSLTGEKKLLLISGCPNQLSASVPYCEFTTMAELAAFVGRSLAPLAQHYDIVVRPHPNYPEFGKLLEPFGIRSTNTPTSTLVPLADLFVAFASATIRWAMSCGVPTINYDVFHYQYGDFAGASGVVTVTGARAFEELARSMVPGSVALRELTDHAVVDSARWGLMDGNGIVRIEEQIAAARRRRAGA